MEHLEVLLKLPLNKQTAFAWLTCERLFRNYLYFYNITGFGDPSMIRAGIEYLSAHVLNDQIKISEIKDLLVQLEKNTPEPGNFDSWSASAALDTCSVLFESLNFLVDHLQKRLTTISTLAIDSVDMYIQEIENLDFSIDKDFQWKIDNHPLMKQEKAIQSGLIKYLNTIKDLQIDDLNTLISLQNSDKHSNLLL